ncbi:MAG TPA: anti-sigma factor [Gemmatimonadales bacterium]|jgi:anti-sigma factor RsiW|nr:anti-sigma factor [Gemmatimonadales bacterium]
MTHSDMELQLDAYLDGELASRDAREFAAHLKECRDCARLHDARVALGAAIRAEVPPLRGSEELRNRVRSALRSAAGSPVTRRTTAPVGWRPLALAASLALVAVGSWRVASDRAVGQALSEQVLTSHVRSLMPGHLTDVVSTDQHTVKPWFNGKLDFSPAVYDFAGRGYPLIGGRLDYLAGRPVAALVYGRRQHLINVFLWPANREPAGGAGATSRQGYHLLHWTTPQYTYWVASDLGLPELRDFAGRLRQADSAATR